METTTVPGDVSAGASPKAEDGKAAPEVKAEAKQEARVLTESDVRAMIDKEVEKVKRTVQSEKDKALARLSREADVRLQAIRNTIAKEAPDLEQTARLADFEAREQLRRQEAQEIAETGVHQDAKQVFVALEQQALKEDLEIDPGDKRFDWVDVHNSANPAEAHRKVMKTVSRIMKEADKTKAEQQKQTFADMEAKLRKDLGLDSVDISGSPAPPVDLSKMSASDKILAGIRESKSVRSTKHNNGRKE